MDARRAVDKGIVVLGERLSWNEPLGGVIVLVGVLITRGRPR